MDLTTMPSAILARRLLAQPLVPKASSGRSSGTLAQKRNSFMKSLIIPTITILISLAATLSAEDHPLPYDVYAIQSDFSSVSRILANVEGLYFYDPSKTLQVHKPRLYGLVSYEQFRERMSTFGEKVTNWIGEEDSFFKITVAPETQTDTFDAIIALWPNDRREALIPTTIRKNHAILVAIPDSKRSDGFQLFLLNPKERR